MLQDRRFKKLSSTGRMVFHVKCEHCEQDFKLGDVEVNHKNTVGTLTRANIGVYVENLLFVKAVDLELLCKPCHSIVTYSERSGMSMEDANIEKKVIKFIQNSAAIQKEKLRKVGIEPGKTIGIRRSQARAYISSKLKGES